MANKYSANEFNPNAAQVANGQGHSWYAKEEIDQIVKNQQIAERLAARTGFKPYEIKAIIEGLAEVSIGKKFSKQFKDKKEVTKVPAGSGKAPKVEDAEPSNPGGNGGNPEPDVIG